MKTDKDFIRQVIYNAILCNPDNESCKLDILTDDLDFVDSYEIPSIHIVAVVAQLEEEYQTELKISDILRLRTIQQIADYIENGTIMQKKEVTSLKCPTKSIDSLFEEL